MLWYLTTLRELQEGSGLSSTMELQLFKMRCITPHIGTACALNFSQNDWSHAKQTLKKRPAPRLAAAGMTKLACLGSRAFFQSCEHAGD